MWLDEYSIISWILNVTANIITPFLDVIDKFSQIDQSHHWIQKNVKKSFFKADASPKLVNSAADYAALSPLSLPTITDHYNPGPHI